MAEQITFQLRLNMPEGMVRPPDEDIVMLQTMLQNMLDSMLADVESGDVVTRAQILEKTNQEMDFLEMALRHDQQ